MKIIFDYNRTIFNPERENLYFGVKALLAELSEKHQLFLISRQIPGRELIINRLGIKKFFQKIYFVPEKNKKLFEEIIQKNQQVMVVGDRLPEEIKIGEELNCITVWINRCIELNLNIKPQHIIFNILEVKEIIKKYE